MAIQFKILDFDELDSTNNYARKMLDKGQAAEGLIVRTQYQSKGKGQQENTWISDKGENLLFSLVLQPQFLKPDEVFLISQFVSLAIYDFLSEKLKEQEVSIKWPNDIYADGKKIAGILIQNDMSDRVIQSIVGIGININQLTFPKNLAYAVSLIMLIQKKTNLNDCFKELLICIQMRYLQLKTMDFNGIRQEYAQKLFRRNIISDFRDIKNQLITGKIIGTTEEGKLMIETKDSMRYYDYKEIEFLSL